MLQDFNFKIVHRVGVRHANVDALSRNPIDSHDENEDFGMEVQDEKKDANVVHVWNSSALSPHILTLSQSVDVELMQKEGQEEVNLSREFAEENPNLLAEAPIPKRRAKGASITDVDYWGLVCEAQEMVDAEMNSIDVSNREEDNGVDETGKDGHLEG